MLFNTLRNTFKWLVASTNLKMDDNSKQLINNVNQFMDDFSANIDNSLNTKCLLITDTELLDLINMLTYNDYAELYHTLGCKPSFEQYMIKVECLKDIYPSIPVDIWHSGYDIVADLFAENMVNPCDPHSKFIINCDQLIKMVNHQ